MLPELDPSEIQHESEVPVYLALRDSLSDEYTVLHSYHFFRPNAKKSSLREAEADFVITHPKRGMLVLEVKGGDRIRYENGKWMRENSWGRQEYIKKDPFEQAQENMRGLLKIIEKKSRQRITETNLTFGYAVVFPHAVSYDLPPPHMNKRIIISADDLQNTSAAIERAMNAWGTKPRLTSDQYQILLNDCLMPKFRLARKIGPDITRASEKLMELTQTQVLALDLLFIKNRVLIKGVAGSGKTFLALHRALALARAGKLTLLTCHNRALARWLSHQVQQDPTTVSHRSRLSIRHFHGLASDLCHRARIDFEPPPAEDKVGYRRFWTEEVPQIVDHAVDELKLRGEEVAYEALVVDEAQDFRLDWWYVLSTSLLRAGDAPIYAFKDEYQSLSGVRYDDPIEWDDELHLGINCRNTRNIATASASIIGQCAYTFPTTPTGLKLQIVHKGNHNYENVVREQLTDLIKKQGVNSSQIAVIGPSPKDRGSLSEFDRIAGAPLTDDPVSWFQGAGILVTTSWSFKGLEADVVVLYDWDRLHDSVQRTSLYVACTRARSLLIAVVDSVQTQYYNLLSECIRASE